MAQVIRKYNKGNAISWQPSNDPNILVYGTSYSKSDIKNQIFGKDYVQYKKDIELDPNLESRLDEIMDQYVQGLIDGRLIIEEDRIKDKHGEYTNSGNFVKGKNLTEEQILNNLSIHATNYLVDRFTRKKPFRQSAILKDYIFDVEKQLSDGSPGGFSLYLWNSQDKKDPVTGLRSTTNRAKRLSDILLKEHEKLYTDVNYRNSFNWRGEDFARSQQNAHNTADKLKLLAEGLADGKVDEEDIGLIDSIGLDADFKKLLDIKTEESKKIEQEKQEKTAQEEKARQEAIQEYGSGYQMRAPNYPWEPYQIYNNGQLTNDYSSPDIINAIGRWKEAYSIDNVNEDHYFDEFKKQGFNYIADLRSALSDPSKANELILLQKDFNTAPSLYANIGGNWVAVKDIKFNNGNLIATITNSKNQTAEYNLGGFNTQTTYQYKSQPALAELNMNDVASYKSDFNTLYNAVSRNLNKRRYGKIIKQLGKNINKQLNGTSLVTYDSNNRILKLYDIGSNNTISFYLTSSANVNDLNPLSIRKVEASTISNKNGGVLKGFNGLQFIMDNQNEVDNKQQVIKLSTPEQVNTLQQQQLQNKPYASFSSEENQEQEAITGKEITSSDKVRLGGAVTDLVSAVGGFIPGLNVASAVVGAGSSLAEYGSDLYDLFTDREGAQGFLSSTGELAMNLGMDLVSLIPAGKSAKVAKSLKTIASYVPHIMGILQTADIAFDPQQRKAFMESFKKVDSLDFSKLNTQDIQNITFALRSILGAKSLKNQYNPSKSTQSTVKGKVKVGDEEFEVSAVISNDKLKKFSSNTKEVEKVLVKAANDDTNIPKKKSEDGNEIKFTKDDIEVEKQGFKAKTDKIKVKKYNRDYTPKKAFEGWFGSEGFNWKISDYSLSRRPGFRMAVMNDESIVADAKNKEVNRLSNVADSKLEQIKDIEKVKIKDQEGNETVLPKPKKPELTGDLDKDLKALKEFNKQVDEYKKQAGEAETPKQNQQESNEKPAQEFNKQEPNENSSENKNKEQEELNNNKDNQNKPQSGNVPDNSQPKGNKRKIQPLFSKAKRHNRIRMMSSKENAEKAIIEEYVKSTHKLQYNMAARKGRVDELLNKNRKRALDWWSRISREKKQKITNANIRKSLKIHNSDFKFMQGGQLSQNEIFLNLLNQYKSGGSLIKKLQEGDVIESLWDRIPYIYDYQYDDGDIFVNEDFDNIYDIANYFYLDEEGNPLDGYNPDDITNLVYPTSGRDHANRGNLEQFSGSAEGRTTKNLTLWDSENLLREYKNKGTFKTDVQKVYEDWKQSNQNGTIKDFLTYYNDSLKDLYSWTHFKTNPKYTKSAYDYDISVDTKDDNTIKKWNELFQQLYPNLTVYIPDLFSQHGSSSVIRFPLYFDSEDVNFKDVENRTVTLGGEQVYFDTKGFLVPTDPDFRYDIVEDEEEDDNNKDDKKNDKKGDESILHTADNLKDISPKLNINKGLIGDLLNAGVAIIGNNRQLKTLEDLKAVFKDPVYKYNVVRGDILPQLQTQRQVASALTAARQPISASSAVQLGSLLDTVFKGNELINKYTNANITAYNNSLQNDQDTRNDNLKSEVDTANANHQAAIAMHNNRITTKNAVEVANTKIIQDLIKGVTGEIKTIDKQSLYSKKELLELSYKESLYRKSKEFDSDLMTTIKNDKTFIDNYKKAHNYDDISGVSDAELKQAYFDQYPEQKQLYKQKWADIESEELRNYITKTNDLYVRQSPLNMITPGGKYNVVTGEYVENGSESYKKGGSLSSSDKMKLQALKDFNKSLREDAKEFNKNARESQREFNKMLKELSKTSLTLLKTAMQIS